MTPEHSRRLAREIVKKTHPDIKADQHVHHIDGNPFNNNIGNLIILRDSDHIKHHWEISRKQKLESLINLYNEGIYI